ncbi:trans isomerase-like 2 [Seminavis robusta]|uniref:Peptidyl-prolyl cis-trans isomerase n=1 Tax=Seminavis robusta TaxID=568900 RepID=A0A9N8DER2_9STRA|nr:trans isomerase-like 2 [Seminavis robusta]|eukprot:Sro122_g059110.1 trans isomerase-like 2 (209) ;mRNA; r:21862-22770
MPFSTPVATSSNGIIVAIRHGNSANVYSYEAYHELNVKTKNWEDLISGETFNRKTDVWILNDPDDLKIQKRRDINTLYHIQHQRQLGANKQQTSNIRHSVTASRISDKMKKNDNNNTKKRSSSSDNNLQQEGKRCHRRLKKKGYVRMELSTGAYLVLEIHCDYVPRTVTNIIKLCQEKKYNGSLFHRLIKKFMIQGGKPPKNSRDRHY